MRPKSKDYLIVSKLLSIAGDKFSNHGCNDIESGFFENLSDKEKTELLSEINSWDGGNDFETVEQIPDWLLMNFYADKLQV